jgi:pimeloyl-ACP methyl ester carboxylesterase
MNGARMIFTVLGSLVWSLILGAALRAQEIVSLPTRPGVTQAYFLAGLPKSPEAVAVLFSGSGGFINLRKEEGQIKFGGDNFLVRSRTEFTKRGVVAAVADAPTDQQRNWGMTDEFRRGGEHYTDIAAVIADLEKRFPKLPLFLVGTSRGSVSAAALGARFGEPVAGLVLSATMFRPAGRRSNEQGPGLSGFDFATIKLPLLLVHHVSDPCVVTPYSDAARLSDNFPLISVFGGSPPQSGPCDPFSAHGFFGKESETVEQIVNWMLKKPFQEEVR